MSIKSILQSSNTSLQKELMLPGQVLYHVTYHKSYPGSSIFDKAVFCLGGKQGMLVNDERSSWCDSIGDFNVSLELEERNFIWQWISSRVSRNNTTPECKVNETECYDG